MKDEIKLTGKLPEIEMTNIHYCMVDECPMDHFQVLVNIELNVPKSKLGDVIAAVKTYEENANTVWNDDDEWELTLKRKPAKQSKL